ncbi:MAG: FKBP-type peptidyl-prolyl cis-trans isomerase [Gemmatimonadaceae bacterium]|nr:FKBP-type peptidyl-prolyl cis-trans isomerase [Gemmatimonadaceae bacterium]
MIPTSIRSFVRALSVLACSAVAACSESLSPGSGVVGTPSDPATDTFAAALGVDLTAMTKKSAVLYVQDLTVGTGAEAVTGRVLGMVYTGWLANGTKFDSNVGSQNFTFTLGAGQVIAGWDQGIVGMKVGGKRRIIMGSALGYGANGSGPIPGNATLVFDVELKTLQ